jgi:DNA-binding Lrp family transcriptional regulator
VAGTPKPDISSEGPRGWVPDKEILELEQAGLIEGFVPRADLAALEVRTVLIFLRVKSDLESLVADYAGPITDAHEMTGSWDALLVTRFTRSGGLSRFLGLLVTDDRVKAVLPEVVERTVLEYDAPPLN